MSLVSVGTSYLGLLVLATRLLPTLWRRPAALMSESASSDEKVSVVIPARNEEANLPKILDSFLQSSHRNLEIVIVNDASRDRTGEIAASYASRESRIKVVTASQRPPLWAGKNWACAQGADVCTGDWILFTDADTVHATDGIAKALSRMKNENLDLLSAVPFHLCPTFWEKLTGPFHIMVFIGSSAFSKPSGRSLFAIGQFLFFNRTSYLKQGGHAAIHASLADDLELAKSCLMTGGRYAVDTSAELYRVRMYADFASFLKGWRRIFRLGFPYANFVRVVELYLVIACVMMSFRFAEATTAEVIASLAGVLTIAVAQRRFGQFSWLGAAFAPFGIGLFTFISGFSFLDLLFKRDLIWRGRRYKAD